MDKKHTLEFLLECNSDIEDGYLKWNKWRADNNIQKIDLQDVDLSGKTFKQYNFAGINFRDSIFSNSFFIECTFLFSDLDSCQINNSNCGMTNFTNANMNNCNLSGSDFTLSQMAGTTCTSCNFSKADLSNTFLIGANCEGSVFNYTKLMTPNMANSNLQNCTFNECLLVGAILTNSNLSHSTITNSRIFGVSVWNIITEETTQENLIITNDRDEAIISVDDIEIAQFIYLISNNKKISNAIDSITSKVVLILGRFTDERLRVLRLIKDKLKSLGFVPILFDFDGPSSRDITETIGIMGRLSKFIVADLTDPKSIPQELTELVRDNPSLKFQPLLLKGNSGYSMFEHLKRYSWVRDIFEYETDQDILSFFDNEIKNILDE